MEQMTDGKAVASGESSGRSAGEAKAEQGFGGRCGFVASAGVTACRHDGDDAEIDKVAWLSSN